MEVSPWFSAHPRSGSTSPWDPSSTIRRPCMTSRPPPRSPRPYRSHTCGQLRASDAGATARLSGWVHRRRDHGQLIFLDLRDRHGITQVVVDAADDAGGPCAGQPGPERVRRHGRRRRSTARQAGKENPELPTGEIELRARGGRDPVRGEDAAVLHQRARRPDRRGAPARYRYLDIRREPMQRRLLLRSPPRPGDPRGPPRPRLRRGRDAGPDQVARPRAPATSSSPAGSSRARSTPCRRARSSSSSC